MRRLASDIYEHKLIRFFNGRVLRDHTLKEEDLWVFGGKIIPPQKTADEEIDVGRLWIAPGYIDLQINGGFGIDFSKQPEGVEKVANELTRFGITAFLPTVISSSQQTYQHILPILRSKMKAPLEGASILGMHLEGPFLNPKKAGAHDPISIRSWAKDQVLEKVYGDLLGVKMVTLAPEISGALSLIEELNSCGIIVSAGHTCATNELMQEAIQKGLSFVTHLFNGMAPFHHRNPGVIGAALVSPKLSYSLIGDPQHLSPQAVALAWTANPEGLILISDAMAALGQPPGEYSLGAIRVCVEEEKATLATTTTLAGSVSGLDEAVRYLRTCTSCSSEQAIEAASYKPAKLLGIEDKKGSLHVGADADFNLLDEALCVQACYVKGKCYFNRGN